MNNIDSSMNPHAIFSIATNGYDVEFRQCLNSQKKYAESLGVPYYCLLGQPPWGISAHDSAWLKVFVLNFLLSRHSSGVLYLDADCEVTQSAPDFRGLDTEFFSKDIFMPLDATHRVQACFIYCRGTKRGRFFAKKLCLSSFIPSRFLPREDKNLYENGHIIWLSKTFTGLHILPQEWNSGLGNNGVICQSPYVLHHGGEVMRKKNNANPFSLIQRFNAALTGFRMPFHLLWYKPNLNHQNQPIPF